MLRIDGIASTMPATARVKAEPRGAAGDTRFAHQLTSSVSVLRSASAPAMAALNRLTGVLALQEIRPPTAGRRRAIDRGEALLETLGELQAALLDDSGPTAIAERLRAHVAAWRGPIDDPVLHEILDAIDLRAQVELAKLERDAGSSGES